MTKKCFPYVRFSSTRQEDGSTRERQNSLIEAFIAKHGLEVDQRLEDASTSAFRGKNAGEDGVLGSFLVQVRKGEIERGSYLLIENFDRLSRDKIVRSQKIFTDLLFSGIKVVVLDKDKIYDSENLDFTDWINALVEFQRANAESLRKSDFTSKAWVIKRRKMHEGEIVTKKVPLWLKVENNQFIVDEEKAEKYRTLFKLSLTNGLIQAATKYNEIYNENLAVHQAQYILRNRKLLGEHTSQKISYDENGKIRRNDEGELIPNYYPQIIDETLFNKVQEIFAGRRPFSGNYNKQRYNIFRDLIYCKWCGGTIRYMNKGPRDYFICTNSMTGKCKLNSHFGQQSIRGNKLFNMFFTFKENLNIQTLLEENTNAEELKNRIMKLQNQKKKTASQLADFQQKITNLILNDEEIPNTYHAVVVELEKKQAAIDSEAKQNQKELDKIHSSFRAAESSSAIDIEELIYEKTEEAIEKRVQYNNELKRIIESIAIDFLNTTLEINFINKVTRYINENGSTIEIPQELDMSLLEHEKEEKFDEGWINSDFQ